MKKNNITITAITLCVIFGLGHVDQIKTLNNNNNNNIIGERLESWKESLKNITEFLETNRMRAANIKVQIDKLSGVTPDENNILKIEGLESILKNLNSDYESNLANKAQIEGKIKQLQENMDQ